MVDTIIVVPCYNEEQRLPAARFEDFLRKVRDVGFILVDDGSRDGTLERLRSLERVAPDRVRVLALAENGGKAEAVRLGVLQASGRGVAYVGFWDADLATPLGAVLDFRRLLAERPELEMVIGARVQLLGRNIERHAFRHYLGRLAATAIALTLGLAVYDTQCGAKLFRATRGMRESFEEPFVSRWLFDVEILARRIRAANGGSAELKRRIYEYPLLEWVDVEGSKVRALDYLRAALDLVRIRRRYMSRGGAGKPAPRR